MTVPVIVTCIVVVACVFDVRTRRIPNVLTLSGAVAGLLYHLATSGLGGLQTAAAGWMLGLLLLLLSASTIFGADFYVSPTAAANGNGSLNSPWKLQTALDHPSAVQPGDTIWLRGGIYNAPPYTNHLIGTSADPIVVRQYPGERARIDGNYNGNEVTLNIMG